MPEETNSGPARDWTQADSMRLWQETRGQSMRFSRLPRVVGSALRFVWSADRRGLLLAGASQLVLGLGGALTVLAGKLVIEAALADDPGIAELLPPLVLLAVITSVSAAGTQLMAQQQRLLGERVAWRSWQRLMAVTTRVDLEMFDEPGFHNQLHRVTTQGLMRPTQVTTSLLSFIGGAVGAAGLCVALALIAPLLLPLMFLAAIPVTIVSRRASATELGFAVRMSTVYRQRAYLSTLLSSREAAKEVRAFKVGPLLRGRYDDLSRRYLGGLTAQVRRRQKAVVLSSAISAVGLAVTLGVLLQLVVSGRLDVAQAGAAVLAIRLLGSQLSTLIGAVSTMYESALFLEDTRGFLELGDARSEREAADTALVDVGRSLVRLEGVAYTYPGAGAPAVQDVSLHIEPGEVVALVGENGSGKTTVAKVVAGLLAPRTGAVGHVAGLSGQDVAVIFQDFVRYELTAFENVALGQPEAMDDVAGVRAAIEQVGAAGFLDRLPSGLDTILSSSYAGGRDLSVGQWQRVALARALRRDAPLVVLDEPTSAMDPRAEAALFNDIRTLLAGRAALLISHRFSSVRMADRIYVMHDGRLVECGTHDELMAAGGRYAELFELQADAYR